ncbi:hypothetical protein KC340_g17531 [Hortaea werneckii]|nr:hypothetical protein KC342_g14765 [Hortaea werneckii]KAI7107276.1 hypothetical protein KC339_g2507 [Hortaea werneckii]KAI7206839.1 hypothetical protein KC365_g16921 [Hortaea werneckii]KAI7290015.1 hypothetical protein KC340_g17531 [Hortaea werneckii]KAI7407457.1 hypothetical protein KC328_g518 [Hortaea werneckii]
MVATRHSLPTTTSFTTTTTSPEPSTTEPIGSGLHSKKQRALLKQLNIDAKDAILDGSRSRGGGGGREDEEEKQVYHYRGSVYEIVGNEPVEWLQQQPERWRRKRDEVGQRSGSAVGSGGGGGRRKRGSKSESAMKEEEVDEGRVWKSPRKSAVNPAKRRRVSGDGYRGQQEEEDADTIPVSMSRRKKHALQKESADVDAFIPANNPAPFSIAEIKENRAQMAINEVLQLAAINSRIHTLAQQHKKMRKELEVLRRERETDTTTYPTHGSDTSKSLEIPDSEGSFTDPVPPRTSTTTTTSSSVEDTSTSRHEDTTNTTTTTTTRSLSTSSSSSTTSSYATATSPTSHPTPSFHNPPNLPVPNSTSSKTNPPPPPSTSSSTSSPPTRPPLPSTQHHPSSTGTLPKQPDRREKQKKEKSWSFLTDLQRGVERGEYDRAEVGVFAIMKGRAQTEREIGRKRGARERQRVGREVEVLRGWEEV